MPSRSITRREAGFVLPTAIFLLVVMALLGAFMVRITTASNISSAQDIQGARAYQAARLGVEAGLYAVQISNNCPGATINNPPGLQGFTVVWSCVASNFTENGTAKTIWRITSTACSPSPATCPSSNAAEMQNSDYVERQLVVVTER